MSIWNNKTIPFWQHVKEFPNQLTIIGYLNTDPRSNWPESFKPSVQGIISKLSNSRTSYLKIKDENNVLFITILVEKIVVSCTLYKDSKELVLNKTNGLQYATNFLKTSFVKSGIRIKHGGIFIIDGKREYYNTYDDTHNLSLFNDLTILADELKSNNKNFTTPNELQIEEEEEDFNESKSSKIEEMLETLEAYINKEYEVEDTKARAEKPFVYTEFKVEDIASTYKYYYRITLLKNDVIRLRELSPTMLKIKKTDESFMDLEVFNIKPENSPNDIIVTTSFQTDRCMIDNSNELYLTVIPTLQKVRQKVIDELRNKVSPNRWLIPLAAGVYSFDKVIKVAVPEYNEKYPLLPSQRDGVEKGAGSKDITLVLGPPGTGKTTVILSWVKFFVSKGMKVLVTSQNNKAVDNVLERLAKEKDLECVRVGNESKVSSSIHNLLIENYALSAQLKLVGNLSENISVLKAIFQFLSQLIEYKKTIDFYNIELKKVKFLKLNLERIIKLKDKIDRYNVSNITKKIFLYFYITKIKREINTLYDVLKIDSMNIDVNDFLLKTDRSIKSLIDNEPKLPEVIESTFYNSEKYKKIFSSDFEILDEKSFRSYVEIDLIYIESLLKIITEWKSVIESERQSSLYETILEYVDVVGATCIGINSNKLFSNIPFDVVIVDESGQIQLHNLMVPLSRASKAILVGDHKQLPPIVDDELAAELEEQGFDPIFLQKSWFEILWNPMPEDHKTMLDTQFRCPAIISDFVSKAFYENKYKAGSGMEKKQPILSCFKSTMIFIDTSKIFPSFEQSRISDGRTEVLGNEVETAIIIKILMYFIKELPYLASENEIGIIVPYKNHVLEVKRAIKKSKLDIGNLNVEDLIASVDSYQGQERDVIIFAFSRSNKGGNIGFLADWRRLNVAMTRTKKQLIMIGSLKTLTKDNQKEHEEEFKQAMRILEEELRDKDSIIDGREFVNGAEA